MVGKCQLKFLTTLLNVTLIRVDVQRPHLTAKDQNKPSKHRNILAQISDKNGESAAPLNKARKEKIISITDIWRNANSQLYQDHKLSQTSVQIRYNNDMHPCAFE